MNKRAETSFRNSVTLPAKTKQAMIQLLNARLADAVDLHTQIKFAHWNVKGTGFYQTHLLFDTFADHAGDQADTIAEYAAALGGKTTGTARQAAAASTLPEYNHDAVTVQQHLEAVVKAIGHHAGMVRRSIAEADEAGDPLAADLFTQIARELEKDLWFAEAHLQA